MLHFLDVSGAFIISFYKQTQGYCSIADYYREQLRHYSCRNLHSPKPCVWLQPQCTLSLYLLCNRTYAFIFIYSSGRPYSYCVLGLLSRWMYRRLSTRVCLSCLNDCRRYVMSKCIVVMSVLWQNVWLRSVCYDKVSDCHRYVRSKCMIVVGVLYLSV